MFRVLLCHRRGHHIGSQSLHDHWAQNRSQLVLQLKDDLGFVRYGQVYQLPRRNLLYRLIRFTRSWLVTSFFAVKQGRPARPKSSDRTASREERWDVVDEFWFHDQQTFLDCWSRGSAAAALRRLVDDQSSWVRRTAVCTAEEYVAATDPTYKSPRITTLFFLRTYPEMTRGDMLRYWGTHHKKLVLSLKSALRYRAYDQLHVRSADDFAPILDALGGSAGEEFDGVASLSYGEQWELILGFFNLRTQIANIQLIKDEVGFIDAQRSPLVFGRERFF